MKKIIMILLLFGIFFTACTAEKEIGQVYNDESPIPTITVENIVLSDPFEINIYSTINDEAYNDITTWEAYMKRKFNLDIDLVYLDNNFEYSYQINNNELGIVFSTTSEIFEKLLDEDLLAPVDDYFKGNTGLIYNDLQLDLYRRNGSVYGIPVYNKNCNLFYRLYDKELFSNYNNKQIDNPSDIDTIDEFLEFSKYMTYNDPDGNGIPDTYGLAISSYQSNEYIDDIYKAFACYFSDDGVPVYYDVQKEKFVNTAENSNIEECLNFIKMLNDDKLVKYTDVHYSYNSDLLHNSSVASTRFNVRIIETFPDSIEIGSRYLSGINKNNLFEVKYGAYAYCVLKSENSNKAYDFISSVILNDDITYTASYKYGIENVDFKTYADAIITYKRENKINLFSTYRKYSVSRSSTDLELSEEIDNIEAYIGKSEANYQKRQLAKDISFSENVYSLKYDFSFENLMNFIPEARYHALDFNGIVINKVLKNESSVQDALEEYRVLYKKINMDEYIYNANLSIGSE